MSVPENKPGSGNELLEAIEALKKFFDVGIRDLDKKANKIRSDLTDEINKVKGEFANLLSEVRQLDNKISETIRRIAGLENRIKALEGKEVEIPIDDIKAELTKKFEEAKKEIDNILEQVKAKAEETSKIEKADELLAILKDGELRGLSTSEIIRILKAIINALK